MFSYTFYRFIIQFCILCICFRPDLIFYLPTIFANCTIFFLQSNFKTFASIFVQVSFLFFLVLFAGIGHSKNWDKHPLCCLRNNSKVMTIKTLTYSSICCSLMLIYFMFFTSSVAAYIFCCHNYWAINRIAPKYKRRRCCLRGGTSKAEIRLSRDRRMLKEAGKLANIIMTGWHDYDSIWEWWTDTRQCETGLENGNC